jgi:hypothetical protein
MSLTERPVSRYIKYDSQYRVIKNSPGIGGVNLHVVNAGMSDTAIGAQHDWK